MKRLMLLLGIVGVALVVAPVGITKTPKAGLGVWIGSTGAELYGGACTAGTFSFTASSGPNGENAAGTFVVDFPGFAGFSRQCHLPPREWTHGDALRTDQRGNGGAADPTTYSPGQDPLYFVAVVTDTGNAKPKQPSPDQMSLVGWDTEGELGNRTSIRRWAGLARNSVRTRPTQSERRCTGSSRAI